MHQTYLRNKWTWNIYELVISLRLGVNCSYAYNFCCLLLALVLWTVILNLTIDDTNIWTIFMWHYISILSLFLWSLTVNSIIFHITFIYWIWGAWQASSKLKNHLFTPVLGCIWFIITKPSLPVFYIWKFWWFLGTNYYQTSINGSPGARDVEDVWDKRTCQWNR